MNADGRRRKRRRRSVKGMRWKDRYRVRLLERRQIGLQFEQPVRVDANLKPRTFGYERRGDAGQSAAYFGRQQRHGRVHRRRFERKVSVVPQPPTANNTKSINQSINQSINRIYYWRYPYLSLTLRACFTSLNQLNYANNCCNSY